MGKRGDERGLVRAACWELCDGKDSCGCAPLCEGWGGVDEWQGEGIGVVNESVANIVVDGDCGVGRKMADGCITSRSAIDINTLSSNAKESPMDWLT